MKDLFGDENEYQFSEQKGPKPKQRFDLVTEDHLFPRLLNKKCLITTETETEDHAKVINISFARKK